MVNWKVKTESLPQRCDICHKSDAFDSQTKYCSRCANLTDKVDESISTNIKQQIRFPTLLRVRDYEPNLFIRTFHLIRSLPGEIFNSLKNRTVKETISELIEIFDIKIPIAFTLLTLFSIIDLILFLCLFLLILPAFIFLPEAFLGLIVILAITLSLALFFLWIVKIFWNYLQNNS